MTRILPSFLILALVLPATAAARHPRTLAPPGDSAVSQYLEVVPTGRGPGTPRPPGKASGALTRGQRGGLDRLGPDGRTLAAVTDSTSPLPTRVTGETLVPSRATHADDGSLRALSEAGTRSPLALLVDAVIGGGSGALVAALTLLGAVGVGARALRRRRAGS